ncbi:hypothetical protein FRC17_006615, partial [Serendipita sp. 399]
MSSINPFAIPSQQQQYVQPSDDVDLFGEEDDEEAEDQQQEIHKPAAPTVTSTRSTSVITSQDGNDEDQEEEERKEERRKRKALEYEEDAEDENVPDRLPGIEKDYVLPNLGVPRSSDGKVWMLRLPHYLKYSTAPFHPDTYRSVMDEEDQETQGSSQQAQAAAAALRLEVTNTMRWRWIKTEDGGMARQSNTRIVKWDDGTMSLQLGDEFWDIATTEDQPQPSGSTTITPTPSQSLSQQHAGGGGGGGHRPQGVSYLVTQHGDQGLLQVEATVTGQMYLRPVGTHSETHRRLVKAVAERHWKVSKLRFASEKMLIEAEKEQVMLMKGGKSKGAAGRRGEGGGGGRKRRMYGAGGGVGGGGGGGGRFAERRRRGGYSDDEDE